MCRRGEVRAVASQDWDTLLYGAPVMIRNLTAHGTRKFGRMMQAEMISLEIMLEELQITYDQLVDLGIMIGTDFHPGIKERSQNRTEADKGAWYHGICLILQGIRSSR